MSRDDNTRGYTERISITDEDIGKDVWKLVSEELQVATLNTITKPAFGDVLEIPYSVNHKGHTWNFRVTYCYPAKVQFPPYPLEDILKELDDHNYKKRVLCGVCGDEDITDLLKQWEGPRCNFYQDLSFTRGTSVLRNLITQKKEEMVITDSFGGVYRFRPNTIVGWHQVKEGEREGQPPAKRRKLSQPEPEEKESSDESVIIHSDSSEEADKELGLGRSIVIETNQDFEKFVLSQLDVMKKDIEKGNKEMDELTHPAGQPPSPSKAPETDTLALN
jgi:hypothetical protein